MKWFILIAIVVALAAFRLAPADLSPITQTESSGEVTATATYTPNQIKLVLDTHSVDLSDFDFATQVDPRPETVEILADSSHHRQALLKYRRLDLPFTLVVSNLGNIAERKLVFEGGEKR